MTKDPYLAQAYTPIEKGIEKVEEVIRREIRIEGISESKIFFSGKRLRAAAVLFSSGNFPGDREDVRNIAASVELIHAASLVHDDVVDEAKYRRDDESLSFRYGNTIAVLAGDFLYNQALKLIHGVKRFDIMGTLLESVSEMIIGELNEEIYPPKLRAKEEIYLEIIGLKTASLFRGAFVSGGLLGDGNKDTINVLKRTGQAFGMAYQIIDDCEDLFKDDDGDILQEKITLPLIHLFNQNPSYLKDYLERDIEELKFEVVKSGGFTYALNKARKYIDLGKSYIKELEDNEVRIALLNFFNYLIKKAERAEREAISATSDQVN